MLVAGILAAAVYSPVLALQTVTVEGTKLLTADQVQTALAPLQGKPLPQISDDDVTALLQPLVQVKEVTHPGPPAVDAAGQGDRTRAGGPGQSRGRRTSWWTPTA